VEIEKFVELGYRRDNEQAIQWKFRDILYFDQAEAQMGPLYTLKEFKLWESNSLCFPDFMGASKNFIIFNGDSRIKNVVVILDLIPNTSKYHDITNVLIDQSIITLYRL